MAEGLGKGLAGIKISMDQVLSPQTRNLALACALQGAGKALATHLTARGARQRRTAAHGAWRRAALGGGGGHEVVEERAPGRGIFRRYAAGRFLEGVLVMWFWGRWARVQRAYGDRRPAAGRRFSSSRSPTRIAGSLHHH